MNRYEYANVIEDLLGLTLDRSQLLPADMAGFGFDNNADVLSITPSIMTRYNAAATKVSRAAVGSLANRPAQQLYTIGTDQQDERMNEDMPFGTHGGLAVRHLFPLDGDYTFTIRLKNGNGSGVIGIEEEQQIELRVDHALVKKFSIGGKYKGADPGTVIAPVDDDIEGQQIHNYRMTADEGLELRLPIKAGTRVVSVAFTDSEPTALDGSEYGRPGIDRLFVAGPFSGSVPEDTPSRRRIFVCHPTGGRNEDACARQIFNTLTRRAYRRPVTEHDVEPMMASYAVGRRDRDFDAGIERALETLLSMPEFLLRVERQPATAQLHQPYEISDLELASRLSFFLWRSIPDDELIDLAAKNQLRTGDALSGKCAGCWPTSALRGS